MPRLTSSHERELRSLVPVRLRRTGLVVLEATEPVYPILIALGRPKGAKKMALNVFLGAGLLLAVVDIVMFVVVVAL